MYLGGFGAGILLHADDVGVAVFYIIQDGVLSVLFLHVPKGHDVVRKEFDAVFRLSGRSRIDRHIGAQLRIAKEESQ